MRTKHIAVIVVTLLILASCGATVQQQWNKLTPDEKGRIVLGGIQDQLKTLWTTGQGYVKDNPQYAERWTKEIVPAFSAANQSVALYVGMVSGGSMTAEGALIKMEPILVELKKLLTAIGVKGQEVK